MRLRELMCVAAWIIMLGIARESLAHAGAKAPRAVFAHVCVRVTGDVAATIVDQRGRRTGWRGHRFEEIPGCSLDVIDDEVAEPIDYTFRFVDGRDATYVVVLSPRTEGEVEISVDALVTNDKRCSVTTRRKLVDDREYQWRIQWSARRDSCKTEMTEIASQESK